jgi:protein-tyrosine-phosphatase
MAAAFLRRHLAAMGVDAIVESAGFRQDGLPVAPLAVDVLAARGIDIAEHRSRSVTRDRAARADLVIGMTNAHVREAVVAYESPLDSTFTLRELVRRAEINPRTTGEPIAAWVKRLGAGRHASDLVGQSADDIADPIGEPPDVYERVASELDDLCCRLAGALTSDRHVEPRD